MLSVSQIPTLFLGGGIRIGAPRSARSHSAFSGKISRKVFADRQLYTLGSRRDSLWPEVPVECGGVDEPEAGPAGEQGMVVTGAACGLRCDGQYLFQLRAFVQLLWESST